jgi:hypothetical protein
MSKVRFLALISLILILSFPLAASDIGFHALAPKAGILFPSTDNIEYGVGFNFGAGADLGELTDNLKLVPFLAYWTVSGNVEGADQVDVSVSNFQIGGDVQYYLENVKGLYFGGGISINFKSISIDYPPEVSQFLGGSSASDSETDFGLGLLGGYEIPVGKNTGFVQAKYNIISDLNTFEINVGMWFDLN